MKKTEENKKMKKKRGGGQCLGQNSQNKRKKMME